MTATTTPHLAHDVSQQSPRPLPHSCGRCGAKWGGSSTAHCGATCHETFTSPRSFDKHRFNGECRPPAAVGLVNLDRTGYQAWGSPIDDEARARLLATRATAVEPAT
jgi:hypothetical protein